MKNTFISQVFPAVTNDFLFHSLLMKVIIVHGLCLWAQGPAHDDDYLHESAHESAENGRPGLTFTLSSSLGDRQIISVAEGGKSKDYRPGISSLVPSLFPGESQDSRAQRHGQERRDKVPADRQVGEEISGVRP